MTAKEMIFKAQEITVDSSMLEIAQAEKNLRTITDIVAGGNLEVAFRIAKDRIEDAKNMQEIRVQNREIVRIM
jgi:hypothetical protein